MCASCRRRRANFGLAAIRENAREQRTVSAAGKVGVALRFNDLEFVPEGLRVVIRRSKTDQDGRRRHHRHRRRPPAAAQGAAGSLIARAGIADDFLFRRPTAAGAVTPAPMSDRAVARLVQARAAAAGYDLSEFAGHTP